MNRKWFRLASLVSVLSLAAVCVASPDARASEEGARAHFASGVKLYDASPPDYAAALAEFRAAYAEKASPGIKRNMALCLRALERYPEAIDALEEMLAEGGDRTDAHVREAATRAIGEMTAQVATVRLRVVLHAPRGARTPAVTTLVDDVERPRSPVGEPIHLTPGEHSFRTRADGFADGELKATLAAGERDRILTVEMVAITDTVLDTPPSSDSAPDMPPPPPRYDAGHDVPPEAAKPAPEPPRLVWYGSAGVTIEQESRKLSSAFDEPSTGTSRDFTGAQFALRIGRQATRALDFEGLAEIGSISPASYPSPNDSGSTARVSVTTWTLAPVLRFHTSGTLRFVAGVAIGLAGQDVSSTLSEGTKGTSSPSGSGIGGMAMFEVGAQLDLGRRVLAEADLFVDEHGVGSATTESGQSLFLKSPTSRSGLRLLLGYRF